MHLTGRVGQGMEQADLVVVEPADRLAGAGAASSGRGSRRLHHQTCLFVLTRS